MLKTTTAIIGGGPVGLLGCLLLSKFNIDFLCFEQHEKLRSHPSAHWLSARSKQIIQQINNLHNKIDKNQEDFNNFKYYRYCK
jgi:2-polyprenyl-6-methoxyphenol hydroxylase-like FAD-dependent oxidoreductase